MEKKKRLHFAVLVSTLDDQCQHDVLEGVCEFAKQNDIHITMYLGTHLMINHELTTHFETCFDDIKNNESLDGLIIFAGFMAHVTILGVDGINSHIAGLPEDFPVVSVSFTIPKIPSIISDNESGTYDTVEHLIKVHNKKEIVFIKGPDGHPEAEERLAGYKKALTDNGLEFNERYTLPGNFTRDGGIAAVKELIEQRELTFDAIAACDDETAIGAVIELKSRDIFVPTDISVIGFDDDKYAETFIPSLSTAKQDFIKIGMVSAEALKMQIEKQPVDEVIRVSPVLVLRQSCGCLDDSLLQAASRTEKTRGEAESFADFVINEFIDTFRQNVPRDQLKIWVSALVEVLKERPFKSENFLYFIDRMLLSYNDISEGFEIWLDMMNTIAVGVGLYRDEFESVHTVLSALMFAKTLIQDYCEKEAKRIDEEQSEAQASFKRMATSLLLEFDIDSLVEELGNALAILNMNTAFVGVYKNPIKEGEHEKDRTIDVFVGFDGDKKFRIKNDSINPIPFSKYSTIDGFDLEREKRTFAFFPLLHMNEELGVLIIPYDSAIEIDMFETLKINVSTAIKGIELLSTIRTLSVTDELTGLLNRRGFFRFAHSKLQHLQRNSELIPIVMFLDMDGLKSINDIYGHSEGDAAILLFAKILTNSMREEDIIGRMGGDEFVILTTVRTRENAMLLEQRLRTNIDEYNNLKLHPYKIESSVGCVILDAATKECFEKAMLGADAALYEEKTKKKEKQK